MANLIKRPEIRIISKDITLATGELVRAFFAVMNIEGRTEIRFLGTKPLEAEMAQADATPLLAAPICHVCVEQEAVMFRSVFLPFFSLDLFANQLARAPSLA
ncbi:MAG: hypothetical protein WC763_00040 [Candidatus Paceibacterota bacterium]|jgi:hypothetical protein